MRNPFIAPNTHIYPAPCLSRATTSRNAGLAPALPSRCTGSLCASVCIPAGLSGGTALRMGPRGPCKSGLSIGPAAALANTFRSSASKTPSHICHTGTGGNPRCAHAAAAACCGCGSSFNRPGEHMFTWPPTVVDGPSFLVSMAARNLVSHWTPPYTRASSAPFPGVISYHIMNDGCGCCFACTPCNLVDAVLWSCNRRLHSAGGNSVHWC